MHGEWRHRGHLVVTVHVSRSLVQRLVADICDACLVGGTDDPYLPHGDERQLVARADEPSIAPVCEAHAVINLRGVVIVEVRVDAIHLLQRPDSGESNPFLQASCDENSRHPWEADRGLF